MPFSFGLFTCFVRLRDLDEMYFDELSPISQFTLSDRASVSSAIARRTVRVKNTGNMTLLLFAHPTTKSGAKFRRYMELQSVSDGVAVMGRYCYFVVKPVPERAALDSELLGVWATKQALARLSAKKGGGEWKQLALLP